MSTSTTRAYFRQGERLENVRRLLSSASSAVRDYLLDPDSGQLPKHREQARQAWAQAVKAVSEYQKVAAPERRAFVEQLEAQMSAYWEAADRSLGIAGRERSESGVPLLIDRLVPLRDALLESINEIGARDRADLRSAAARSALFVQAAERRLWLAVTLTVLLSLLVAGTTVRYLVRLENTALAQYEDSIRTGAELESLSRRLLTLQEDERRQIARELHDDYGQRMASLLLELSALSERTDAPACFIRAIQAVAERLGGAARDLQQLSRSLHSAVLDKIGLEAAIRCDCDSIRERTAWKVDFQAASVPKRLPEPLSLAAYRVFQEALQNALKHSRSNRLTVSLSMENGYLALCVQDYGQGFDIASASREGGLGLVSMRERLRMVGGDLAITSETGKGTRFEARIPAAL